MTVRDKGRDVSAPLSGPLSDQKSLMEKALKRQAGAAQLCAKATILRRKWTAEHGLSVPQP